MKGQMLDIMLPGASDTIEVAVDWDIIPAFMEGLEGGEPAHPEILGVKHNGEPLELTDEVYYAVLEVLE